MGKLSQHRAADQARSISRTRCDHQARPHEFVRSAAGISWRELDRIEIRMLIEQVLQERDGLPTVASGVCAVG